MQDPNSYVLIEESANKHEEGDVVEEGRKIGEETEREVSSERHPLTVDLLQ